MALEIGQEAPDFTLVNEDNEQVTLSGLRGSPVVLVFYTFDFSGICTNELCEIRDDYSGWSEAGATVFGISRDSRFAHAAFKQAENLSHSLLADLKGEWRRHTARGTRHSAPPSDSPSSSTRAATSPIRSRTRFPKRATTRTCSPPSRVGSSGGAVEDREGHESRGVTRS